MENDHYIVSRMSTGDSICMRLYENDYMVVLLAATIPSLVSSIESATLWRVSETLKVIASIRPLEGISTT